MCISSQVIYSILIRNIKSILHQLKNQEIREQISVTGAAATQKAAWKEHAKSIEFSMFIFTRVNDRHKYKAEFSRNSGEQNLAVIPITQTRALNTQTIGRTKCWYSVSQWVSIVSISTSQYMAASIFEIYRPSRTHLVFLKKLFIFL